MTVREQYWKYSLFALILGLGTVVFIELMPFMGGILGAVTIYVLLRHQMAWLTTQRKWHRSLAATLLLAEAILCFLIPISGIAWLFMNKIQDFTLDPQILIGSAEHVAGIIRDRTGYDPLAKDNVSYFTSMVPQVGQWLMDSIISFTVNVLVLLFVLYFMLIGGYRMEDYFRALLPFNRQNRDNIMKEIHLIVRSNAIGIPFLALTQGVTALLGYLLFGVPAPFFWGLITCFATVIPVFGTAIVWVPMVVWLAWAGSWGSAIGLFLYAVLVIVQVDNIARMAITKKMADVHPLVTIFGVFIGLSLFGFMGVIFGPLLLALFILCVRIFKEKYLEGKQDIVQTETLSTPSDDPPGKDG